MHQCTQLPRKCKARQCHPAKAGSHRKVHVLCVAVVPSPVHWSLHVYPQLPLLVVRCIICVGLQADAQVITRVGAVLLPHWLGDPLTGRTRNHELSVLELWAGDARQENSSCGVALWGKWSGKQQSLVLSSSCLPCGSNPGTKLSLHGEVLCASSHCRAVVQLPNGPIGAHQLCGGLCLLSSGTQDGLWQS